VTCQTCGRDLTSRECSDPEHRAARADYVKNLPGQVTEPARAWSKSAARHFRRQPYRRPRERYCAGCNAVLYGGHGGNIHWIDQNGRWTRGAYCQTCHDADQLLK